MTDGSRTPDQPDQPGSSDQPGSGGWDQPGQGGQSSQPGWGGQQGAGQPGQPTQPAQPAWDQSGQQAQPGQQPWAQPGQGGPGGQGGQPGWGQPAYGAPGPGGYAPQGGYGGPPGPGGPGWGPSGPGWGPPPGPPRGSGYDVTQAFSYAWKKFSAKPSELLVPALVVVGASVLLGILLVVLVFSAAVSSGPTVNPDGTVSYDAGPGFLSMILIYAVVIAGSMLLGQFLNASMARAALDVVDGRPVTLGSAWSRWSKGQVALAAVLLAVGTLVGYVLCFLPAIVFLFFTQYTVYFVVDQGLGAVDAIKASVAFVRSHLTESLLLYLLTSVAASAGAFVCGIGLLFTLPIAILATAYTFRVLHGRPVSPPA